MTNTNLSARPEERWRLARRDDLANVFGIVLTVPFHGEDESGNWRYGIQPYGGMGNQEIIDTFEREMREIILESVSPLVNAGVFSRQEVQAIQSHGYETGPAAQSWPQFFFEVYQQAEPFISGSANLIAIAEFIRQVAIGIEDWQLRKRQDMERALGCAFDPSVSLDLDPGIVLTLPNLVALCCADLVQRHEVGGEFSITVFPRNRFEGYASSNHPAGGETYVIRFTTENSNYFYLVDGMARVTEHYRTTGDDFELLPLPDLLPNATFGNQYRRPEHPLRFRVQATATSIGPD